MQSRRTCLATKHKVVIDANIARSSGMTEHPVSKSCREALEHISKNDHSFVLCKTLLAEWKRHQSNYSKQWLASMFARRKVVIINHEDESKLKIATSKARDESKNAALKDSHLIDAAGLRGRFVTSSDDRARKAFAAIPELYSITRNITWLNPVTESDTLTDILKNGKKPNRENKIRN